MYVCMYVCMCVFLNILSGGKSWLVALGVAVPP